MKYRCVVVDLDGTLLNSNKEVSKETKDVIIELIKKGVHFVPATGRAFFAIPEEVRGLDGVKYAVTSNGVAIYDVCTKKAVSSTYLPVEFVTELLELLRDENVVYECFCDGQPYTSIDNYNNPFLWDDKKSRTEYIRATRKPVPDIEKFILENVNEIAGIDIYMEPAKQGKIRKMIESECAAVYITSSSPDILEISNADSGKHRGVARLCELLDIDISQVVAFGDNDNDIEMLREVGLAVAMENATPECKVVAHKITASNDEDGVGKMLKEIFGEG